MIEAQRSQPSMAMVAQKFSGTVCESGVLLDDWVQFTPPPPAQITFEAPTQALAQIGQNANGFIQMG